jgi:hypothetical protein
LRSSLPAPQAVPAHATDTDEKEDKGGGFIRDRRDHIPFNPQTKLDVLSEHEEIRSRWEYLSAHKVALVVPAQGIDTSEGNPAGKFQLHQ